MNGAEILVNTLLAGEVDLCFSNPGTSEMHFVAALDRYKQMRCVLGLFEGVVTGAADGYFRMTGKPAATLLHLGPGLANGASALHNAMKAQSGIVNVVGDHASWHLAYDAPLRSDLDGIARPVSHWLARATSADDVERLAMTAIARANQAPGEIATLVLPGDAAWNPASQPFDAVAHQARRPAAFVPAPLSGEALDRAAAALRSGEPCMIFLGGRAVRGPIMALAGKLAAKTGAKLFTQTFCARAERGAGRVSATRLPYMVDLAVAALAGIRHVITIQADPPVGFFAYPGKPSLLAPPEATIHALCRADQDPMAALDALVEAVGAGSVSPVLEAPVAAERPRGPITPVSIGQALAALIPEGAIVVDESITTGLSSYALTSGARPHDWLQNMGGSIGFAPPVATGVAIACPDRKVLCLTGDGSAMYSLQALWTQARESLDVVTVVYSNRAYRILQMEFAGVGAGEPGPSALSMMDIGNPDLDWVKLGEGMGVPSRRVTTIEDFCAALDRALAASGPQLIEVML